MFGSALNWIQKEATMHTNDDSFLQKITVEKDLGGLSFDD